MTDTLKLQLQIELAGKEVIIFPKWTLEREISNPQIGLDELVAFRSSIRKGVEQTGQYSIECENLGGTIYGMLFRDAIDALMEEAANASSRAHLELRIGASSLEEIPWEALRPEGGQSLGQRPDLTVVRVPRDAKQAILPSRSTKPRLSILPIAPDPGDVERLSQSLASLIDEGWVELQEPIVGDVVSPTSLGEALRKRADAIRTETHVIHYIGHGSIAELIDEEGEPLLADWLANVLQLHADGPGTQHKGTLRLVFFQACEGARPGAHWSTAGVVATRCNVLTIAHLFKIDNDSARKHASIFYKTLLCDPQRRGDVALAMQAARSSLTGRIEAVSPVLVSTAKNTKIFDVPDKPTPRRAVVPNTPMDIDIAKVVFDTESPFTLFLGDLDEIEDADKAGFRKLLADALLNMNVVTPAELDKLTMSALAQRFALHHPANGLNQLLKQVFREQLKTEVGEHDLVDCMAKHLRPGVHVSLTWLPRLERAIAKHHVNHDIFALVPDFKGEQISWSLWKKAAKTAQFTFQMTWPDGGAWLGNSYVVLHLRGGYPPSEQPDDFRTPVVTEDAHVDGLASLTDLPKKGLLEELTSRLRERPVVCVAMTALSWRHRLVLRRLLSGGSNAKAALVLLRLDKYPEESDVWGRGELNIGKRHFVVKSIDPVVLANQLDNADFPGGE